MPSNFIMAGLIPLILPKARIIHVSRDPVDTCLSGYTKLFAKEQLFTYDLKELGEFHRAYQRLMDYWRTVLPAERFTAMVRLDQNRAQTQLAKKAGVDLTAVKDIFIYGNHSPSMFPAFEHASIGGKAATRVITDLAWLQGPFCETVGKRGAAVIAARGASSAASAANALVDHVRSLVTPGAIHSVAVKSKGHYGFDPEVWAGMPVRTTTAGSYEVITGYAMDDFAKSKLAATNQELVEERAFVADMIK